MKKYTLIASGCCAFMVVLALFCSSPQNPFSNPKSAAIVADSSLTSLKDSVAAFTTAPCTVSVYLPDLMDSFFVTLRIDSLSNTGIASGKVTSEKIAFPLPVEYPGTYTVTVRIVKIDKTVDSLTKTFTVFSSYAAHVDFVLPQKDSLRYHREYACSCTVTHPELADSLQARLIYGSTDTVLVRTKAAAGMGFRITVPAVGAFSIRVNMSLLGGGSDSATKALVGYIQTPVVTPDSAVYHVILPLDSFNFNFTAIGPDSNLRFGYTWIDTAVAQTQTTAFVALKPFHETFSRTIHPLLLHAALHAPLICHAYAIDADSLFSAVASCTLYVTDTTKPGIRLLAPDTAIVITTLPVPIKAIVTDLAGVNTVTFNGASMVLSTNDTASYVASSIDSGKSLDSIIAFDNSGNRAALVFPLKYAGKKLYPPQIKDLSRATTEGHPFDSLYLDTCVIITDTSIKTVATYKKDSLSWLITDSAGGQIGVPASHKIAIPFPTYTNPADTEWTGTIKLTFKVMVKNTMSLYDTKQPSFFVTEVYDPPVITYPQSLCSTVPYSDNIFLDTITTVRAIDNKLPALDWKLKTANISRSIRCIRQKL
jgi:hypothetical protein